MTSLDLPELQEQILKHYPTLYAWRDGGLRIRGTFPVAFEGRRLDEYQIEIMLPTKKHDLPVVREIGGRIPRTEDHHINPDGSICLFVPDERWRVFPDGATILDFLHGPVRSYFIGESLVALGEPRPFGERSHGAAGIRESYEELLGTSDPAAILRYLDALGRKKIKGHHSCPCGNGKKLRDCHAAEVQDLRSKIPPQVARRSADALRKHGASPVLKGEPRR